MIRAICSLCCCGLLGAQTLIVDRGLPPRNLNESAGTARANVRFEWNKRNQGFVGDQFQAGSPGELWVIDRVRTWAVPGTASGDPEFLGDRYEKISLYGGLNGGALKAVASAALEPGSNRAEGIAFTLVTYEDGSLYEDFGRFVRVWQIDFTGLNWSVAGGAPVEFGVMGVGRAAPGAGNYLWFNHASHDGTQDRLRMFRADGGLEAFFDSDGAVWNKPSRINVQVWGHLAARVGVNPAGEFVETAIYGGPGMDINRVDAAALRLGPKSAAPVATRLDDADGDGLIDLVARFSLAASGLAAADPKACITGTRLDGVHFEGCGALAVVK